MCQCAFAMCQSLKAIRLPASLQTVSEMCFALSGLEEVRIPRGVKQIEKSAFHRCAALRKVAFSDGSMLRAMGQDAFKDCNNLREAAFTSRSQLAYFAQENLLRNLTAVAPGASAWSLLSEHSLPPCR